MRFSCARRNAVLSWAGDDLGTGGACGKANSLGPRRRDLASLAAVSPEAEVWGTPEERPHPQLEARAALQRHSSPLTHTPSAFDLLQGRVVREILQQQLVSCFLRGGFSAGRAQDRGLWIRSSCSSLEGKL